MKKNTKKILTTAAALMVCAGMAMSAQAAWKQSGTTWYYDLGGGRNATGWHNIDATWYYFNGNGQMLTGWQLIGGEWYYMRSSGAMVSDQWIGNYYLGSSGAMLKNQWVGPYYVGHDGAWIPEANSWDDPMANSDDGDIADSEVTTQWLTGMDTVTGNAYLGTYEDTFGNEWNHSLKVLKTATYHLNGEYESLEMTIAPSEFYKNENQVVTFSILDEDGYELCFEQLDVFTEPIDLVIDVEDEELIKLVVSKKQGYEGGCVLLIEPILYK